MRLTRYDHQPLTRSVPARTVTISTKQNREICYEETGAFHRWSHRTGKSLALAHIRADIADGAVLAVQADGLTTSAKVVPLPFYDSGKSRTHA